MGPHNETAARLWDEIKSRASHFSAGAENIIPRMIAKALRDAQRLGLRKAQTIKRQEKYRRAMAKAVKRLKAIVGEGARRMEAPK